MTQAQRRWHVWVWTVLGPLMVAAVVLAWVVRVE